MQKKYVALATAAFIAINPISAHAEGKDGVAAVINGEKVTVAEIRKTYSENPQLKDQMSFEDFYAKALDIYVNGKLLYQAAEGEKITESPEYKKQMQMAKEELARKIYLEKKVGNQVNDAAVKKLYDEYKSNFKAEKEIRAKHILVDSESKAKEVIEALAKGEKFDALAKKYSKEPAELGYFTKQMMVPEFGNAAFAMKKGETSKNPVKTKFGYHVIMVEDIRETKLLTLKQAEPQLKGMLTQQAVGGVFVNLFKNAKIEKYDLKGNQIKDPVITAPAAK